MILDEIARSEALLAMSGKEPKTCSQVYGASI